MPLTQINNLGITNGTIINADINASAAIDATKLSAINGILLDTQTITTGSVVASVSVNSIFTTTYKTYLIIFSNIATDGADTANNNIILQWKDTSNSTITSNYSFVGNTQNTSGNITASNGAFSQSSITIASNCYGASDTPISGYVYIFNPRAETRNDSISQMMYHSNGGIATFKEAYALHQANTAIGGFIISASGNATQIKGATGSGFIKTYGLL